MKTVDKNMLITVIWASVATFGVWWVFNMYWEISTYWWVYPMFFLIFGGGTYSELNKQALLKKQSDQEDIL